MGKMPMLTNYVSDIDQLLVQYAKTHPEFTASQRKELVKHERIDQLRDKEERPEMAKVHWDHF